MVLKGISSFRDNKTPLELVHMPVPVPEEGEILVKVSACGVCHELRVPPVSIPPCGHKFVTDIFIPFDTGVT